MKRLSLLLVLCASVAFADAGYQTYYLYELGMWNQAEDDWTESVGNQTTGAKEEMEAAKQACDDAGMDSGDMYVSDGYGNQIYAYQMLQWAISAKADALSATDWQSKYFAQSYATDCLEWAVLAADESTHYYEMAMGTGEHD